MFTMGSDDTIDAIDADAAAPSGRKPSQHRKSVRPGSTNCASTEQATPAIDGRGAQSISPPATANCAASAWASGRRKIRAGLLRGAVQPQLEPRTLLMTSYTAARSRLWRRRRPADRTRLGGLHGHQRSCPSPAVTVSDGRAGRLAGGRGARSQAPKGLYVQTADGNHDPAAGNIRQCGDRGGAQRLWHRGFFTPPTGNT